MSDFGCIADYIVGGAVKRLSAVECDPEKSNQHELNGTLAMRKFMGTQRAEYPCIYLRLEDDSTSSLSQDGVMTWYDARESHSSRTEYRFYYQDNPAISMATEGDTLAIILKKNGTVLFLSAPEGSQPEREVCELFETDFTQEFHLLNDSTSAEKLSFTKRTVLGSLGIEIEANYGTDYLDRIAQKFGGFEFPTTWQFSEYARELAGSNVEDFPSLDSALMIWWDTEEAMFRQLESVQINEKLQHGFDDTEDFLRFSQKIRQRRFSRAGKALENHLVGIFDSQGISYAWGKMTELRKTPDFIFPSIEAYQNDDFSPSLLNMLGVKTTCKDRWRQVLTEANRINHKHLFTLQPAISENQTNEMQNENLQLILPAQVHASYTPSQRSWLWSLDRFVHEMKRKQQSDGR